MHVWDPCTPPDVSAVRARPAPSEGGAEPPRAAAAAAQECVSHGPGREDRAAHAKLQQAQFLVKKSQRVDLYELLGVQGRERASVREIRCVRPPQRQRAPRLALPRPLGLESLPESCVVASSLEADTGS
eukprot:COSAG01_NODE_5538_length_4199_cov_2.920244_6_plen_129_part_00